MSHAVFREIQEINSSSPRRGLRALEVCPTSLASGTRVRASKGTAFTGNEAVKEESPIAATLDAGVSTTTRYSKIRIGVFIQRK